jgi:hypothetical protein
MSELRNEVTYFKTTKSNRRRLEQIAKQRNQSMSSLVDLAVMEWLDRYERPASTVLVDTRAQYDAGACDG